MPSAWDNQVSEDDKAQLLEYVRELAEMKAWEDYLAEKDRIANQARSNVEAEMRARQ